MAAAKAAAARMEKTMETAESSTSDKGIDAKKGGRIADKSRGGFTIVEVAVASALLLLAGFALYSSVISASRMTEMAKDYTAAQGIAFDTLWELYNRPFSEFENITAATNWTVNPPNVSQLDEDCIVRVAVFPPSADAPYWEIESNVAWSRQHSSTISNKFSIRRYRTERF